MSGYDADVLLWSERQAVLLRRLATGERVSEQIDWDNVIEEIESVVNEQLQKRGQRAVACGQLIAHAGDDAQAESDRLADVARRGELASPTREAELSEFLCARRLKIWPL